MDLSECSFEAALNHMGLGIDATLTRKIAAELYGTLILRVASQNYCTGLKVLRAAPLLPNVYMTVVLDFDAPPDEWNVELRLVLPEKKTAIVWSPGA